MFTTNKKITLDCDFIVSYNMNWKDAVKRFKLDNDDIQKVYLRYIIVNYGIKKAEMLLYDIDNTVKDEPIH